MINHQTDSNAPKSGRCGFWKIHLHPTCILWVWLAGLLVTQVSDTSSLLLIVLLLGIFAVACYSTIAASVFRRTRWLLLTMMVLYVFFSPGLREAGLAGQLGITEEGIDLAAEHLLHLLAALAWVVILLGGLGPAGLVAGLHGLFSLIPGLGPWTNRMAVRLALTLGQVREKPASHWSDWLSDAPGVASPPVQIHVKRWSLGDSLVSMLTVMVLAAAWVK